MKRSNSILVTCLVLAVLTCACKPRKPWIVHLRHAQVLVNTKPAEAIAELELAAKAGADPVDVEKGLGIAHERLKHSDEALRLLRGALAKRPDDPEVRLEIANIEIAQKRFDAARAELEPTLKLNPPHVQSLLLYAALVRTPPQGKDGLESLNHVNKDHFAPFVDSAEYAFARASFQAVTGDIVAAEATLAEASNRSSLNPTLALGLAELSRSGNTTRLAEWLLIRASNTLGATDSVHVALAELALALKQVSIASGAISKLHLYDKPDVKALLLWADLLELKHEQQERVRVLKKALDLIAKNDSEQRRSVAMNYAIALQQVGNAKQAESVVSDLLSDSPGFPPARILLANLYLAQKKFDEAIQTAEAVAKGEPMRTEAYRVLVSAHLLKKSPVDAESAARRFVESSNSPDAIAFLANFLVAQKQQDKALREIELGLARFPNSPSLIVAQVALTERIKGFTKAEAVALAAASVNRDARIQLELAHLYERNKRLEEAISVLQKSGTNGSGVLLELSALQVKAGRPADASSTVQKLVDSDPYDIEAQLRLGMLQERLGQVQRAVQAYESVIAFEPDNIVALNNLATVLGNMPGNTKRAVEVARKAIGMAPNDLRVVDTLGWVLIQNNEPADRVESTRLLERSSAGLRTPESIYHYAFALAVSGKLGDAKALLIQVLSRKQAASCRPRAERLLEALQKELAKSGEH